MHVLLALLTEHILIPATYRDLFNQSLSFSIWITVPASILTPRCHPVDSVTPRVGGDSDKDWGAHMTRATWPGQGSDTPTYTC